MEKMPWSPWWKERCVWRHTCRLHWRSSDSKDLGEEGCLHRKAPSHRRTEAARRMELCIDARIHGGLASHQVEKERLPRGEDEEEQGLGTPGSPCVDDTPRKT